MFHYNTIVGVFASIFIDIFSNFLKGCCAKKFYFPFHEKTIPKVRDGFGF